MKGKQSFGGSSAASQRSPIAAAEPDKQIRFISLHSEPGSDNFDIIKDIIKNRSFNYEFIEFKFTNTVVQHRKIQAGQPDSPKERIEFEEKIDINSSFKYLRQLSSRVLQEVNNILLVQINQIKAASCSLPIIFPEILKSGRFILVHGITYLNQIQLLSKPDFTFRTIDDQIQKNTYVRSKILERAEREKSMQAIARELKDFVGFPQEISEKLHQMVKGSKVPLSDEEAVNMILISDLYSRYQSLFRNFENDIANKNQPVAALATQFAELTQGIKTKTLIEAFEDFLLQDQGEQEILSCENNSQLFSYIYKNIQRLEENRTKVGDQVFTRADLFASLRSMITSSRSQIDPSLWSQCKFFLKHDDVKTEKKENINTLTLILNDVFAKLKVHQSASSLSLLEIHLIHNIHRFIAGKKVLIAQSDLSKTDMDVIKSAVIPILYQPETLDKASGTIRLILGMNANLEKLVNPVHTVGRVYGFIIGRRLRESVQQFLKPGLRELLSRFGRNFFSIFYEMAVQESGLPISRNQFAQWLQLKAYFKKPEDFGYVPNQLETIFDPWLSPEILTENGESCFPKDYTESQFTEEFLEARNLFYDFLTNLKKDGKGFSQQLTEYITNVGYNLKSSQFKVHLKKQRIYATLVNIYQQACTDIGSRLLELSVNEKLILKVPLEFEPYLLIENIFIFEVEETTLQVHLIAVPEASEKELESASRAFSQSVRQYLKGSSSDNQELVRASRILNLFQKVYVDYLKYLLISILDRQINNTILKIRQQKNQTPSHIQNYFENHEKLFVGSIKSVNLTKLLKQDPTGKSKKVLYSLSLNQIIKAMILYKSAASKLRDYRSTAEQIINLLNKIHKKSQDEDSVTYLNQINKFHEMICSPIVDLNESVLNLLSILATKIDKTFQQNKNEKGAIAWLNKYWKSQNPAEPDQIEFHKDFLKAGSNDPSQKLFLEIAKSREILLNIQRMKCLIFFPELQSKGMYQILLDVAAFIIERNFNLQLYVEISGLNKEQIEHLSEVIYPGNFFRLDRIKPIRISD